MDGPVSNPFSRLPHHSQAGGSHESSSVSSNATIPALIPPPSLFSNGSPAHSHSLVPPLHQHHSLSRSPRPINTYSHPYASSAATSPSTTGSSLHDRKPSNEPVIPNSRISPTHVPATSLSAQKRAYRQRRKDPSCDACRERKVKCDATETSSCSECSSRSVKCQFTKETNRRMSSIKQVQDLQGQLQEVHKENHHLRSLLQNGVNMEVDRKGPESPALKFPSLGPSASRKPRTPSVMTNFDYVRKNIRIYGRGVFKAPHPYRPIAPPPTVSSDLPALPPKHAADRLIGQYYHSIHRFTPLVNWPAFSSAYEDVYAARTFHGAASIWVSLFFAILACGTLSTLDTTSTSTALRPEVEGMQYLDTSARLINFWNDELTVDHARTAFLISVFTCEMNLKSAAWVWLGSAVRIAQDIGLHSENAPYPGVEREIRRRVWWSIYAWDRLLALDTGRPLLINDEDCDVGLPSSVDDRYIQPHGILQPPTTSASGLTTIVPAVRLISQLTTTLKSPTVPPDTLLAYDEYFGTLLQSLPEQYNPAAEAYLDSISLYSVFVLLIVRFHLYRHNLSTACYPAARVEALNRCVMVAQDTAKYISRSLQAPPPSAEQTEYPGSHAQSWQTRIATATCNLFCMHLWRCALVLCFRADYLAALTIIRACSAIGETRKVNVACGRNLTFLLDRLLERMESGNGSQQQLDGDEEMLAYVSGDMQGSAEESWVWAGSETGVKLNATAMHPSPAESQSSRENGETMDGVAYTNPPRPGTVLTERESREWVGWERVERMIRQLMDEQRSRLPQPGAPHPYFQQSSGKRLHLAPDTSAVSAGPPATAASSTATSGGVSPGGSSRISIANILGAPLN